MWGRIAVAAGLAGVLFATAACGGGGQGGSSSNAPAASGSAAAAAGSTAGGPQKIFVIGGKSDDPFWSKVKRGVDDAAQVVTAGGGTVTFLGPQNYDNLGADASKLIDGTISQGATAVIAPDWVPDAMDPSLKRVTAAGIPLFIYNAGGLEAADSLGAVNYIGTDEYPAGIAGGQALGAAGIKHAICVNTLPGTTNAEDRCRGLADGIAESGGKSEQLALPANNFGDKTAVAQAIKAAALNDETVDAIVTIGTTDSDSAVSGLQQGGLDEKVKLATFDTDDIALKRVQDGTLMFAVDQQPYLQGFLATSLANGYASYGLDLPTRPVLTGPLIIDANNVESALAGSAAGVR
jgi:simple sugar transport system substrate-binding protein